MYFWLGLGMMLTSSSEGGRPLQRRTAGVFRDYVREAQIKWVRAGVFRRWNAQSQRMSRSQELHEDDFVVGGETLGRVVVSHPWLSKRHPDPNGHQLKDLVDELDRLSIGDDELVFYDYCSLSQVPRSQAETNLFRRALNDMHLLYTMGDAKVLVLPGIAENAENPRAYNDRGWCFFELSISADHGRICNADDPRVSDLLEDTAQPLHPREFRQELAARHFTGHADRGEVERLFAQVVEGRQRECRRCVGMLFLRVWLTVLCAGVVLVGVIAMNNRLDSTTTTTASPHGARMD